MLLGIQSINFWSRVVAHYCIAMQICEVRLALSAYQKYFNITFAKTSIATFNTTRHLEALGTVNRKLVVYI